MTELVQYDDRRQLATQAAYADAAVHRLAEWAQSATAAYEVARRLVGTSFSPVAYRGKPEEATAAILAGSEVGLSPMAALRAFDVIQGQAAPRAITLRAIVQSQGHQIELVESTNTRCRMRGKRRGETTWQSVTWTIDRARELGLTSKDQWRKQPGTMLLARATSEIARLIAADAILGIAYSVEEYADSAVPEAAEQVEPAAEAPPNGTRRMSRPRKPEPAPEPEPVEDEHHNEPPMTAAQQRHMHALLHDLGVEDRDQRLRLVSDVLGREVATSKELSTGEASVVIDELKARAAEHPEPVEWEQEAER